MAMKKQKRLSLMRRGMYAFVAVCLIAMILFALLFAILIKSKEFHLHLEMILVLLLGLAFAFLLAACYRYILLPYIRVSAVFKRFSAGRTVEELFHLKYSLTNDLDDALDKVNELLDRQAALRDSMKQAEYLALQNQINPHFLYNTLEAIRGDALQSGMGSLAEIAEALATYFRYTISKMNRMVTVEDEINNVRNYFRIQRYRYGDRMSMTFSYDRENQDLLQCRIPKLTLQPIVENAVIHGLEAKVGAGHIQLKVETTQSRLLLHVIDDGVGMDRESLQRLSDRLMQTRFDYIDNAAEKEGGIALVNVNNRLRLLFGEQYGLNIYSETGVGTDVEITLPLRSPIEEKGTT
jgi:two-component system, sensor histidine kinase YesM